MNMQFQPNDPPGKLSCDKLEVIQYRMGLALWDSKLSLLHKILQTALF